MCFCNVINFSLKLLELQHESSHESTAEQLEDSTFDEKKTFYVLFTVSKYKVMIQTNSIPGMP